MAKSTQSNNQLEKPRTHAGLLIVVLLLTVLASTYYWLSTEYPELFQLPTSTTIEPKPAQEEDLSEPITIAPSPEGDAPLKTPTPLIPDRGTAGTFAVSSGDKTDPQMTNVEIDPLDAKKGDNLKIRVTMTSVAEVSSFKGWVKSDTSVQELNFSRLSREGNTEVWSGSVVLSSSVDYTYALTFEASDGRNKRTLPLGIRTP